MHFILIDKGRYRMTDKKYIDEDTIFSLELIATTRNCNECKIRNCKWGTCNCSQITANAALGLINRQQAEIEMLENENQSLRVVANSYKLHYNETSAEAIKEFTERLKNKIKTECNPYGKPTFDYDTSLAIMRYIDNLVKEMVGETDD